MAERLEPVQDPGADSESGTVEGAEPKDGKRRLFTLLLIPLILLPALGGAWVSYSQYDMILSKMSGAAVEGITEEEQAEEASEPVEYGEFAEIQNLIVNPSGTDGTRFLMISLGIESKEAAALEEVKAKDIVVRDTILKVLGERPVESLTIANHTAMKSELLAAINALLSEGKVERLYFTQYVLQ